MEVRILDQSARQAYGVELAKHDQNLAELRDELKVLRAENSRNQLFVGANMEDGGIESMQNDGDKMLEDASRLQDKTAESLSNTMSLIADSKMVGLQTVEDLEAQRNQIRGIDEDVMRLEDNLVRADVLIKNFGKRMATDKVIQCFACVNILMVVGVIIYAIVDKGGLSDKDSGSPTEPY